MKIKLLFSLWFVLIVFFSVVPKNTEVGAFLINFSITGSGFFQHVSGYLILSFLASRIFDERRIWLCLAGIFFIGLALEIIQYTLPTRSFNPYDLLANSIGIFVIGVKIIVEQTNLKHGPSCK